MVKKRTLVLLLLCFTYLMHVAGCGQRNTGYSDGLVVLPGAKNARFSRIESWQQITYTLREDYPASDTIWALSMELEEKGWQRLTTDLFNPHLPSQTGEEWQWGAYADGEANRDSSILLRTAQWKNSNGDIVCYTYMYKPVPTGNKGAAGDLHRLSQLEIVAVYYPRQLAQELANWIAKGQTVAKEAEKP